MKGEEGEEEEEEEGGGFERCNIKLLFYLNVPLVTIIHYYWRLSH